MTVRAARVVAATAAVRAEAGVGLHTPSAQSSQRAWQRIAQRWFETPRSHLPRDAGRQRGHAEQRLAEEEGAPRGEPGTRTAPCRAGGLRFICRTPSNCSSSSRRRSCACCRSCEPAAAAFAPKEAAEVQRPRWKKVDDDATACAHRAATARAQGALLQVLPACCMHGHAAAVKRVICRRRDHPRRGVSIGTLVARSTHERARLKCAEAHLAARPPPPRRHRSWAAILPGHTFDRLRVGERVVEGGSSRAERLLAAGHGMGGGRAGLRWRRVTRCSERAGRKGAQGRAAM